MIERKRIEEIAAEHGLTEGEIDIAVDGLFKLCKKKGIDIETGSKRYLTRPQSEA